MKKFLKSITPAFIFKLKNKYTRLKYEKIFRTLTLEEAFTKIYTDKLWGESSDVSQSFYSGTGSHSTEIVSCYVEAVSIFLKSLAKKPNVVDLGCGDFAVGAKIRSLCKNYIACDVVPALIESNKQKYQDLNVDFRAIDITQDTLPEGDIVFIRQVLQHLSNQQIQGVIKGLVGKYKYLILTEHLPFGNTFTPNIDKPVGPHIRIDQDQPSGIVLTQSPFNLLVISETVLCEVEEYGGIIRTIAYQLKN